MSQRNNIFNNALNLFGDSGFWKKTLSLSVPVAMQNLLVSSFALVDTLMVGQLGDVALSSVGMASQWSWLLTILLFGICSGSSIFIAQYWGVKNTDGIHKVYGIAIVSALIGAIIFLVIAFFAPIPLMKVFNRTPEVVECGRKYLVIACFSYPAVALSNVFGVVLRSCERVRLTMFVSLFTTIENALLNYILIFGKFGMPAMGISGAALATCISAWTGTICVFVSSLIQKNILAAPFSKVFGFGKKMLSEFYSRSAIVIFGEVMWGMGTVCYNIIFSNLGYEEYAALTIVRTIENISFVLFIGFCSAACVMIGKSVGSGKIERAILDAKRFFYLVPIIGVIIGAILIIFRYPLIFLFNMSDALTATTLTTATSLLIVYAIEISARNIPYMLIVGVFRSGGDTKIGLKYDALTVWAIALPLTFISAFILKLPFVAVFAVMYAAEDYIKCVLCVRHLRSNKWIMPVTVEGRKGLEDFCKNSME